MSDLCNTLIWIKKYNLNLDRNKYTMQQQISYLLRTFFFSFLLSIAIIAIQVELNNWS